MTYTERRKSPRREPPSLQARDLACPDRTYKICCLSETGLRLLHPEEMKRGEVLALHFTLERTEIEVRAEVAWSGDAGPSFPDLFSVGLMFVVLSFGAKQAIARLV